MNAFTTRVRALHTRLRRTWARWPRYSFLRARARRVVGLAGRTGRGRPAPRQAQTVHRTVCVRARPCPRTKLQPTRARPTAVSRFKDAPFGANQTIRRSYRRLFSPLHQGLRLPDALTLAQRPNAPSSIGRPLSQMCLLTTWQPPGGSGRTVSHPPSWLRHGPPGRPAPA